jgi:SAM-dependent methyltransferase
MIDLLDPRPGHRILELAAGPGETGFLALARVLPGGTLLSTDLSPEMVDAAERRAAALGLTGVTFAVEDAAALSVADDSVDGILCRFGLMLVPEMERVAGEIARVLQPAGRAVLAVWSRPQLNPWMTAAGQASVALGFAEPPDPDAPGPFRLSDPDRLRAVISSGGLAVERIEEMPVAWAAESLDEWWEAACDMSPTLAVLLADLSADEAAVLRDRAEALLQEYVAADGSVAVPGLALVAAVRTA